VYRMKGRGWRRWRVWFGQSLNAAGLVGHRVAFSATLFCSREAKQNRHQKPFSTKRLNSSTHPNPTRIETRK
jgi:hypothetical protein